MSFTKKSKIKVRDIKRAKEINAPIYLAEMDDGILTFWCHHCFGFHTHGDRDLKPYEVTHRVAHCDFDEKKEFHPNGYYLFYKN